MSDAELPSPAKAVLLLEDPPRGAGQSKATETPVAEEAVSQKDASSKLREEIRSLMWQRRLGIVAAAAAAFVWLFSHRGEIAGLFRDELAEISIETQDSFFREQGIVELVCGTNVQRAQLRVSTRLSAPPGSCVLRLFGGGDTSIWEIDVTGRAGMVSTIRLPDQLMLQVRVALTGLPKLVERGGLLTFSVSASARGYLWIYTEDVTPAGQRTCSLLFPTSVGDPAVREEHSIEANVPRTFPTSSARFFAGPTKGEETIHAVVTSSDSEDVALQAIVLRCGATKAVRTSENIGAISATYQVQ